MMKTAMHEEADNQMPLNAGLLPGEPVLALPTLQLLFVVMLTSCVVAGGWWLIIGNDEPARLSGLAGAGLVGGIGVISVLIMTPWRERPAGWWMTAWLGGSVFRMLITPLAAWLLYSALSQRSIRDFVFAIALTHLLTLVFEAILIARHAKRKGALQNRVVSVPSLPSSPSLSSRATS
ncbi:MAG: hypothetical protein ACR2GY_04660 [Phycisphaerales bacterium]